MIKVILESPYTGDVRKHTRYARRAMKDSIHRGEAPLASHLLYTQRGILKDGVPEERQLGIDAGLAWLEAADLIVFYADYGFSSGMLEALQTHCAAGKPIEIRYLFKRQGTHAERRTPPVNAAKIDPGEFKRALAANSKSTSPAK